MIEQIDLAGLRPGERGYATGNPAWPLARVRMTPVQDDPGNAAVVNGPVATRQVVVEISSSLVDAEGQVLTVGGRLLVQEASRHSRTLGGPARFDPEAWMAGIVGEDLERLIAAAIDLSAAEAAGFLVPPDAPTVKDATAVLEAKPVDFAPFVAEEIDEGGK